MSHIYKKMDQLPIEIVYEILCHNPEYSYFWILSKKYNEYWKNRILDTSLPYKNILPTFILLKSPLVLSEKLLYNLAFNAKFIITFRDFDRKDIIQNILANLEYSSIKSINLGYNHIDKPIFNEFKGINFTNYIYELGLNDEDIVKRMFPKHCMLYKCYTSSARLFIAHGITGLEASTKMFIIGDKIVIMHDGEYFNDIYAAMSEYVVYNIQNIVVPHLLEDIIRYKNIKLGILLVPDDSIYNKYTKIISNIKHTGNIRIIKNIDDLPDVLKSDNIL